MNNNIQSKSAFSLVEIMVVISIISLLTYMAATIYPKYVARSQVTAAIRVLESYSVAAQNYFTDNNSMPSNINQIGGEYVPLSNDPIGSITILSSGTPIINTASINATFVNTNNATQILRNQTITLQLVLNPNNIFSVSCISPAAIPNDYLPSSCSH